MSRIKLLVPGWKSQTLLSSVVVLHFYSWKSRATSNICKVIFIVSRPRDPVFFFYSTRQFVIVSGGSFIVPRITHLSRQMILQLERCDGITRSQLAEKNLQRCRHAGRRVSHVKFSRPRTFGRASHLGSTASKYNSRLDYNMPRLLGRSHAAAVLAGFWRRGSRNCWTARVLTPWFFCVLAYSGYKTYIGNKQIGKIDDSLMIHRGVIWRG